MTVPAQTQFHHPKAIPHWRRNLTGLLADMGGYGMAIGFINPTTVIPVLIRQLSSSSLLVGLITTVWMGGWLLPQLPAGRWLSERPHKKPYLLWGAGLGRPAFLLLAVLFALVRPSETVVLLLGLFIGLLVFRTTDSVAAVSWYDILSRAVPDNRRGRVIGTGQILAGVLALVAALVVRWALGPSGPVFPQNFALLFALTFVGMVISWIGLAILVELPEPMENGAAQPMNVIEHVRHVVQCDRAFRQVTLVRLLAGLEGLALPFYVVHATRELGLPTSFVGLAVAVQNISTIASSLALGALSERRGSARIVQVSALASTIAPLTALALHTWRGIPSALLTAGYLLAFAAINVVASSIVLGYLNYVIEIAPPGQRPAYLGLTNTISGLLVVLPVIGGAVLQTTSYTMLFAIAATGTILGWIMAWDLPSVLASADATC